MAKIRATGADMDVLTQDESVYGTAPAGNWRRSRVTRWMGGGEKPLGYEPELGLGPEAQDPYYDPLTLDFTVGIHARMREVGMWLKRLFGPPITSGADPYTHVFSSGAEIPSFSSEEGHTKLTTARYFLRTGCKLGTMGIELSRSGPLAIELTGSGQNVSKANSSVGGTPVVYADVNNHKLFNNRLLLRKDSVNLGYATGGRIDFSNNVEKVETIGRGDGLIQGVDEGERTAQGVVNFRLTSDLAFFDAGMATEAPFVLSFAWTTPFNAAWKLDLQFNRCFGQWTQPPAEGPGGIEGAFTWRSAKGSSNVMIATLINDISTYA